MNYEMHTVYDNEQNHVSLGAHFRNLGNTFGFEFGGTREITRSKVLVNFRQNYFTVDVDIPNAFFADGRTPSAKDVIVSSVTFGRLLLFAAESSYSNEEVKGALRAVLPGFGGGSITERHEKILSNSSLRVVALGGSGTSAAEVITNGPAGIAKYIDAGADYSPSTPAHPLSYQITYLSDFSTAKIRMGTVYSRRVCNAYTFLIRNISFEGLQTDDGWFDSDIEVYGTVTVRAIGAASSGETEGSTQTEIPPTSREPTTSTVGPDRTSQPGNDSDNATTAPEKTLWKASEGGDGMVVLYRGQDPHSIETIQEFEFPLSDSGLRPGARLRFTVELYEEDGENGEDDYIGARSRDILLSEIPARSDGTWQKESIDVSRGNNSVRVAFEIRRN